MASLFISERFVKDSLLLQAQFRTTARCVELFFDSRRSSKFDYLVRVKYRVTYGSLRVAEFPFVKFIDARECFMDNISNYGIEVAKLQ